MAEIIMKDLCKSYDGEYLAVNHANLEITDNEFCVLLGPSGCGKTTLLRMIAGLEAITGGDLYLDGLHMNNVLPKDRDIAMVFQSYALYPHMSVYKNMAFGLKMKKVNKDEIDKRIKSAAASLDLVEYMDRKPRNLSGGQQQRVALGRALVKKPKVFLMDEPLSNLDAKLRQQTRETIVKIHESADATTIYVTHDQVEAMTMATKIVIMNKGVIQQIGTPDEIFTNPVNMFVAGFIGAPPINFVKGSYRDGLFVASQMQVTLNAAQRKALSAYDGKAVIVGIRPDYIALQDDRTDESDENTVDIKATFIERMGAEVVITGENDGCKLTAKIHHAVKSEVGSWIKVWVDASKLSFFDPATENAII